MTKAKIKYIEDLKTPRFVKMSTRPEAVAAMESADVASVPAVPGLVGRILKQVKRAPGSLWMHSWHSRTPTPDDTTKGPVCGTAHCVAGWAIHMAGKAGYELQEEAIGAYLDEPYEAAGKAIFLASCPWLKADHRFPFWLGENSALRWLEEQAKLEAEHLAK